MDEMDLDPGVLISGPEMSCIKQSIIDTFSHVCNGKLKFLGIDRDDSKVNSEGMVGIISLVGDVAWALLLEFPKETINTLAPRFAGFEIDYESDDMGDIVGELANIVAGTLSAHLNNVGVNSNLSLPTVAKGSHLKMMLPENTPTVRMGFATQVGELWLKVAIGRPLKTITPTGTQIAW